MRVKVRLGEPFWRIVGERNLELELSPGSNVRDLLAHLCREFQALEKEFEEAPPQIFIEDIQAKRDSLLSDGARIHLVWAVSGG